MLLLSGPAADPCVVASTAATPSLHICFPHLLCCTCPCVQSLSLPGISGLHVMPLTKSARQLALDFLADGTLPSSTGSTGSAAA